MVICFHRSNANLVILNQDDNIIYRALIHSFRPDGNRCSSKMCCRIKIAIRFFHLKRRQGGVLFRQHMASSRVFIAFHQVELNHSIICVLD